MFKEASSSVALLTSKKLPLEYPEGLAQKSPWNHSKGKRIIIENLPHPEGNHSKLHTNC